MRGYVSAQQLVFLIDEEQRAMSGHFDEIYAAAGAPSVPPETLLKTKVLRAI